MSQRKNIVQEAKAAAQEQINEAADLAQEALKSAGYIYPIKGIFYLISHPSLHAAVLPILTKLILTSLGIVAGVFFFGYLPQVAALALISGPLAFIAAVPLCLSEAYVLVMFVAKTFVVSGAQDKIFDATMLQLGHDELVGRGRQITTSGSGVKKLGKTIASPLDRFSTAGLVRYLVSLPLNALPVVGTALFLIYNGKKSGPSYINRYLAFKKFNASERERFIHEHQGGLTSFGIVALVLQLVPIVGLAFMFSTTCGAALYASDLERNKQPQSVQKTQQAGQTKVEL